MTAAKINEAAPRSPDISHFRVRSADFESAFSVIASPKPTASRRSEPESVKYPA
jgi:hypothetical protein